MLPTKVHTRVISPPPPSIQNAVVDQFRDKDQQRPSVDTERPDLPLVVYLDRGRALLYRSLSGTQSMHKRGYRDAMHAASLKVLSVCLCCVCVCVVVCVLRRKGDEVI